MERKFLKFYSIEEYERVVPITDENQGKPLPSFQKEYPREASLISLISPDEFQIGKTSFLEIVNYRHSSRKFLSDPLTLEELSFLLWCTQGVKVKLKNFPGVMRTVPSAGAKSPFETYLAILNVEGLKPGLYRYIGFEHKLLFIKDLPNAVQLLSSLAYEQTFVGQGAVVFIWVAIPYRTEWRYSILSPKFIAVDLGHVSQSLYLACEAIHIGTCAIGYYDQPKFDALLEIDGTDEFTVLIAPVGKISTQIRLVYFFQFPKKQINTPFPREYQGVYQMETFLKIKIIREKSELYLCLENIKEKLKPYNELEFYGGTAVRAVRFHFDPKNPKSMPDKLTILMGTVMPGEILDFQRLIE